MKAIPVKVNGEIIGHGFIDDAGCLHIRLLSEVWIDKLTAGTTEHISIEEE